MDNSTDPRDRGTSSGGGDKGHPGGENKANPGGGDYTLLSILPVFFLLGLVGVVICHVLKKKGYRCTTEAQGPDEVFKEEKDPELGGEMNDTYNENNDTVGQIVTFIMNNEANSDALKAMVHDTSIDSDGPPLTPVSPTSPTPPLTPVSPGAPAAAASGAASAHTCSHLHTIGGVSGHKNVCLRCNQKKWPLMRKPSAHKAEQRRGPHGEVTVLAVGRFRVTKCEKPVRERRALLTSDSNGAAPSTEAEAKNRSTSEQTENLNIAKG